MPRIKLDFPDHTDFRTEMAIRISDVNYGGHLGHDAVVSLFHEARVRYLNHLGFSELDVGGAGILLADLAVVYRSEGFYGNMMMIEISVGDIGRSGCELLYRMSDRNSGKEVARAKTGLVFFNYGQKKVTRVPDAFMKVIHSDDGKASGDLSS